MSKTALEKNNSKLIEKMDGMTVKEIETFGSTIQNSINKEMDSVLSKAKMLEVGNIGDSLSEVATLANKTTNGLNLADKLLPLKAINKMLNRYDSVEKKMMDINKGLDTQKEKLNSVLDNLLTSKEVLEGSLVELKSNENQLKEYVEHINGTTDVLRLQAATNRLKTITTLRVGAEQSLCEVVMIIQSNKEIVHQLEETVTNIVPLFRMQLVNALSIKAHKEALDLRESVTELANKMVVENAKNIQKASDRMLDNRQKAIISPESLSEANEILQNTVKKAIEMSGVESQANIEVVKKLQEISCEYANTIKRIEDTGSD